MGAIHGVHAGHRAVHAKGSCCTGTFVASPEATALTRAPHLQGDEIPVTVRFSNGSGKPTRADGAKDERGMAVKFHLPDGTTTDIVSLTLPVFFVRNPDDFLAFLESQRPDPETGKPDLDRVGAFVNEHPETQKALGFLMMSMSPASFAQLLVLRHPCVPLHGSRRDEEVRTLSAGSRRRGSRRSPMTRHALWARTTSTRSCRGGSIPPRSATSCGCSWPKEEDDPNDPTEPWPEERELVTLGHMTITEFAGKDCEPMIFDPGQVIDGIERSDDPILHARSDAYSVSFARRTGP